MIFLIDELAARQLAEARASFSGALSSEQIKAFEASNVVAAGDPKNVTRAGSTMEIRVEGLLTEKPDLFAAWFGGGNTTYDSIVNALSIAANDRAVKDVVLRVNSPGGTVDGLFDALAAIETFKADSGKKLRVVASKAQSAAYAIASMAGPITAKTSASMFGSIGTAIDFTVFDGMRRVWITNTDSPAKRPDPMTDEGRAEIVKFLDAVNGLFVDAIARGRGTTVENVTQNFGRGATFVAAEAKRLGMIDSVPKASPRSSGGPRAEAELADVGAHGVTHMDLETLKTQHPDVYKAAFADGVASERDRVVAHLTMGEACGCMPTAIGAVKDGSGMSATLQAQYMASALNKNAIDARQADTNATAATVAGATTAPVVSRDMGDLVAAQLFGED